MNPPLTWQDGIDPRHTSTPDLAWYAVDRGDGWHLYDNRRARFVGRYATRADAQAAAERIGGAK